MTEVSKRRQQDRDEYDRMVSTPDGKSPFHATTGRMYLNTASPRFVPAGWTKYQKKIHEESATRRAMLVAMSYLLNSRAAAAAAAAAANRTWRPAPKDEEEEKENQQQQEKKKKKKKKKKKNTTDNIESTTTTNKRSIFVRLQPKPLVPHKPLADSHSTQHPKPQPLETLNQRFFTRQVQHHNNEINKEINKYVRPLHQPLRARSSTQKSPPKTARLQQNTMKAEDADVLYQVFT